MDIITGDPTTVNAALATRCAGLVAGYTGGDSASASMSVTLSDSGVSFTASSATSRTHEIFSISGTLYEKVTDTSVTPRYSTTTTLGGSHAYSDVSLRMRLHVGWSMGLVR